VSAFAKTEKNIYYSEPVSFTSLGSAAPIITAIIPTKGIVGDTVIIQGQNFGKLLGNNIVRFNTQDAVVFSASETVLMLRVPSSKGVETVEISVITSGQTVTDRSFSYLKPEIIDFLPKTGIYLDTVYVKERNYSKKDMTLVFMFGEMQATTISVKDSVFKIVVPSSKGAEKRQISCSIDGFKTTTVESFTYHIPVITKIEPTEGINGDIVRIKGQDVGYRPSDVKIRFGDKDAFMIAATDTVITVISPMMNPGVETVTVMAVVDERTVTSPQNFRYQKPVIASFEPQNACGGDTVVIRGQYFLSTHQMTVSFGQYAVEKFGKISDTEIQAIVPFSQGTEEVAISVRNNGLTGISENRFRYLKPEITGITPEQGLKHNPITITGHYFGKFSNNLSLYFGEEKAAVLEHTPNKLIVSVPKFSGNKLSEIKIIRDGLTVVSEQNFQYIEPLISDFSPSSGKIDATITISGQYFSNNKNDVRVYCGDFQLDMVSCSENRIVVTIPNTAASTKQPIRVSVEGNDGFSAASFEIISPWTKRAPLPTGRRLFSITSTYNNEGYVALGSGRTDCWKYNPTNDQWQLVTDYWSIGRTTPVSFQIGNYWFYGGGDYTANNLYRVSLETLQLEDKGVMPNNNMQSTFTFVLDNKAYVCGGNRLNTVWQYDPQTEKWTKKAPFPSTGRDLGIAFSHNGKGYAGCGAINLQFFNDLYEYNPQTDSWTQKANFPIDGISPAVIFTVNNRIFVGLGQGRVDGSAKAISDIWEYIPASDRWNYVATIPNYAGYGAYVFVINNKAYIGGGSDHGGTSNMDLYEFDPSKLE